MHGCFVIGSDNCKTDVFLRIVLWVHTKTIVSGKMVAAVVYALRILLISVLLAFSITHFSLGYYSRARPCPNSRKLNFKT